MNTNSMNKYFKFQIEDCKMAKSTLKNVEYVLKGFFIHLNKAGLLTLPMIDYTSAKVIHRRHKK